MDLKIELCVWTMCISYLYVWLCVWMVVYELSMWCYGSCYICVLIQQCGAMDLVIFVIYMMFMDLVMFICYGQQCGAIYCLFAVGNKQNKIKKKYHMVFAVCNS